MYDYGARNYDPALGRWMNIDPLAEKYFDITTYNYVANNPINAVDPDGMDKYIINNEGKVTLALKEKGNDILYAIDGKGNLKDTNKDKKTDEKDGITIESVGLIGQLAGERSGWEKNGDRYWSSIGDQSKKHEDDYFSLFKYISDNTNGVEFSLTFFKEKGRNWIELATYRKEGSCPGPCQLGSNGIEAKNVFKHYHNHPDIESGREMSSMGIAGSGQLYNPSDAWNAVNEQKTYPGYVYFPLSKKLYNITQYGIQYIKKINESKDLK